MDLKCFVKTCTLTAEYYCKCQPQPEKMCKNHYFTHSQKKTSEIHKLIPIFLEVKNDSQKTLLLALKAMMKKTQEVIETLSENISNLMKISKEFMKIINELNKFLVFNVDHVSRSCRFFIPPSLDNDFFKQFLESGIGIENLPFISETFLNSFEIPKIQESFNVFSEKGSKLMKNLLTTMIETSKPFSNDLKIESPIETEIFFFKQNSSILLKFTPQNELVKSVDIKSIGKQGSSASISRLSKDILFIYGGFTTASLSTCFKLNISNFSVFSLPAGLKCFSASGQVFEDKVYIFGGSNGANLLNFSRFFDLSENRWVSIAPLPSPQKNTSTLLIDFDILVTGFKSFLYSYEIQSNQYKNINCGISIGRNNILVYWSGQLFLLNGKFVYLCQDLVNKNLWVQVNSSNEFEETTCKPCYFGKWAYFVSQSNKIYRFDFQDRVVSFVQMVS